MTHAKKVEMENLTSRNQTVTLSAAELEIYRQRLVYLEKPATKDEILDKTICQNSFEALALLPEKSIDLMFADPPYNLTKQFGTEKISANFFR